MRVCLLYMYEGDSLTYHLSSKFSTLDSDHDVLESGSCAVKHRAGWWYKDCLMSNLNGLYREGLFPPSAARQGIYWYTFRQNDYALSSSQMKIRPYT